MPKKKTPEVPTFARPPFFNELQDSETQKNFDSLAPWQRHLVKRLISHGDLARAAEEAGVSKHAKQVVDLKRAEQKSLIEALDAGGLTAEALVTHLRDCLEANIMRFDKQGNPVPTVDKSLKHHVLRTIFELRGDFAKKKSVDEAPKADDLFEDTPVS